MSELTAWQNEVKMAIVVSYVEEQNCPSKPQRTLVSIPTKQDQRDDKLIELFFTEFDMFEFGDDATPTIQEKTDYGDLSVSEEGCHLFITFVEG